MALYSLIVPICHSGTTHSLTHKCGVTLLVMTTQQTCCCWCCNIQQCGNILSKCLCWCQSNQNCIHDSG